MKGRKPQPTYLKILKGNPGHRPLPQGEPAPPIADVCPGPPEELRGAALAIWEKVAPGLFAMQLLSHLDVEALATIVNGRGAARQRNGNWRWSRRL
jgi:phage terminase small subunit